MRLIFTKGSGKYDRLDITTSTGPQPAIACPKQGIIPHDMVHFAVESAIETCGFLGSIAAGGGSGFRAWVGAPHQCAIERLVETVQAEAWSGAPVPDEDFIALYRVTCQARGDPPHNLDTATLGTIRKHLAERTIQWAAVPIGGSLCLNLIPSGG